jgi:hypothetical protein
LEKPYCFGVGLASGDVEVVDLVVCLWCFFEVWAGVVDVAAPEDVEVECVEDEDDDEDVDGAIVGFGAGAVDCAAATIGRPSAIARLTNFFISFLLVRDAHCIVIPGGNVRPAR